MKQWLGNFLSHIFESKTYGWLILFALLALLAITVADLAFHENLWKDLIDFYKVEVAGGVGRAATNDGLPNAVRMFKGTDSVTLDGQPVMPPEALQAQQAEGNLPPPPP